MIKHEYANRLLASAQQTSDYATQQQAQAHAHYSLKQIEQQLELRGNDPASRAHKGHIMFMSRQALPPNGQPNTGSA